MWCTAVTALAYSSAGQKLYFFNNNSVMPESKCGCQSVLGEIPYSQAIKPYWCSKDIIIGI